MLIKVCGMKSPDNIREVEALGVDLMGFIFYPPSPRYVGSEVPSYMPGCRRVGVFVNEEKEVVLDNCRRFGLDSVQFHGKESAAYCAAFKAEGLTVIKAFSISGSSDLETVEDYEDACDLFVFDTKCSSVGGSGVSFDWSILSDYKGRTGFLLSGGIGPDSDLKAFSHPMLKGYDLNSRFESTPGVKDTGLLEVFIDKIKNGQYE